MDSYKEKKAQVIKERIFDTICLAASYGILFLLPQETGFIFYLVFGISAFLFCIGFFRLGLSFDVPAGTKGAAFGRLVYAGFGILIVAAGVYGIYRDHGSGRSIMIATLLLIEGICLWKMGSGSKSFNRTNNEIQAVPGMKLPIEQLCAAFAGVETQLGYGWIGKVKTIKQDSIIFGPSEDGFVVYGYYLFGQFYVAGSTNLLFPRPEDAQGHLVKEVPDCNGKLLAKEDLLKAYADMFARYAKNNDAHWSADISEI